MAHDTDIRFKCRALFEIMDMTLSDIKKQESVGLSTLSDWKNDDRDEFGGIWVKGCKAGELKKASKSLQEELGSTSVYEEMSKRLAKYHGVDDKGGLEVSGMLDMSSDNKELKAKVEADVIMLGVVSADWFDSQLLRNSLLSSIVLNNQVKKDVTKVKQADIKASSEIHKIAKEARFGKSPDTIIFNANGTYTPEELDGLTIEQLEELARNEQKKILEATFVDEKKEERDTQGDTQAKKV